MFEKVIQGLRERGSWRPNRTEIFWPPTLIAVNIVSFSFSRCSTGGPGPTLLGDGFLYCILSATSLVPKLHRGSRGPLRPGVVLPTQLVYLHLQLYCNCHLTSVLTELYNSSTPTRSPTRSLEWHDWSSSSGNNCHAVHRSLSLPCPISAAKSTHAISFDYWQLECVTSFRCITL